MSKEERVAQRARLKILDAPSPQPDPPAKRQKTTPDDEKNDPSLADQIAAVSQQLVAAKSDLAMRKKVLEEEQEKGAALKHFDMAFTYGPKEREDLLESSKVLTKHLNFHRDQTVAK
ncbi:uncharacterized protein J4E92_001602 [Alternaria infectoria]|uniref:uncharacterized protein n=1 Tax=Alternaria infectoria TaxID=45303 RepID=UPI00222021C9|nr:uncharacterized protein J4E92_001602 [Alternaria infectoria]KAI4936877.1 hypothetical protein J4E92_001602 [Alternaria infectoria]